MEMKGLALSEKYFFEAGLPMLQKKFPDKVGRIAAGLVGDGSECFGFDDDISRDHDWGPSFCLWLTRTDYDAFGASLQEALNGLPKNFAGFKAREESEWGGGRTGVFETGSFFKQFIGSDHPPEALAEWRMIPETYLAVATNGKIFTDPLGEVTAFRNHLKAFYPEDIRLKKIAARCMSIGQSGQYNHVRCIQREEWVASHLNDGRFISDIISMVFLLNKTYRPFYKWMHRALKTLPILGDTMYGLLLEMVTLNGSEPTGTAVQQKLHIMAEACRQVVQALRMQGLSDSDSMFLLDHGPIIQSRIKDPGIRGLNVWSE